MFDIFCTASLQTRLLRLHQCWRIFNWQMKFKRLIVKIDMAFELIDEKLKSFFFYLNETLFIIYYYYEEISSLQFYTLNM